MLWFLKLTSPLVLVVGKGKLTEAKGRLPSSVLRELRGVISEAGVSHGTIHADGAGRYHFSAGIPEEIHQRLRNILIAI